MNDHLGSFVIVSIRGIPESAKDMVSCISVSQYADMVRSSLDKNILAVYPFERSADALQYAEGYLSEHRAQLVVRPQPDAKDNALALEIRGLLADGSNEKFDEVRRRLAEHRLNVPPGPYPLLGILRDVKHTMLAVHKLCTSYACIPISDWLVSDMIRSVTKLHQYTNPGEESPLATKKA